MSNLIFSIVTLVFFTTIDRAIADSTAPSNAVVQEIFRRYSPRLQGLTPPKVEGIWRGQAKSGLWFQSTYDILERGKDDPGLVNKLRVEMPCEENSTATMDQTYAAASRQYRCTAAFSVEGVNVTVFLNPNVNDIGTLNSAVVYQHLHGALLKKFMDTGLNQRDATVLAELHFDVKSRIDNARAPSGSFVEYDKIGNILKFAVRFK